MVKISTTRSKAPVHSAGRPAGPRPGTPHRCCRDVRARPRPRSGTGRSRARRSRAWSRYAASAPSPQPTTTARRPTPSSPVALDPLAQQRVRVGAVPRHRHLAGPALGVQPVEPLRRPARLDRRGRQLVGPPVPVPQLTPHGSDDSRVDCRWLRCERSEPRNSPCRRGRPLPMREPPPHVSDDDVLATVREHWAPDATRAQHLPVGFGAHHWAVADGRSAPALRHPGRARAAALRGEPGGDVRRDRGPRRPPRLRGRPAAHARGSAHRRPRRRRAERHAVDGGRVRTRRSAGPRRGRGHRRDAEPAARRRRPCRHAGRGSRWSAPGTPRSWPWRSAARGTPGRTASAPAASWPSGSATSAGG